MDWTNAKEGMAEKIADEGDRYLDGQLTIATSSDQRASVLAGIFTAAATAILAGLASLAAVDKIADKTPIYAGGIVMGILFFVAAFLCILAMMPADFFIAGTSPDSWAGDVAAGKEVSVATRQLCENMQKNIADNLKVIGRNARLFKWGAILGIGAPLIGTLVLLLTPVFRHVCGL